MLLANANRTLNGFFTAMLIFVLAGCSSSERGVIIEVVLKTDDAEISIDAVNFTSAHSLMKASASRPESAAHKTVKHQHNINSSDGNFVIVELLRNGERFRSEIYQLDPQILSKTGNQSDWTKPDGMATDDDGLHWRLMSDPDSFKKAEVGTDFFTELRYEVSKR